jgi:hypothetical protein
VKILFFMRHPGYTRNFESTLRLLTGQGHQVELAFERRDKVQSPGALSRLVEELPSISYGPAPRPPADAWRSLVRALRLTMDYLRYLEPRYRDAAKLRQRAGGLVHPSVRRLTAWPLARSPVGLGLLNRILRTLEQAAPGCSQIDDFIRDRRPDIVLVTPLVELGSWQADYVRSAQRLGVRTALLVHSWDNLTNKGLIRDAPDIVIVWNEMQKQEAVELHRIPARQIVVTGASAYDHWFDWSPSRDRETFCRRVGLQVHRPYLLYLCSSPFIAPDEVSFVRQWVGQVRQQGGNELRDVGVLIRPHPQNAAQWQDVDLSDQGQVTIWPPAGADPVNPEAKADYYDSIYHCTAVVGLNTSALIEGAIVGRSAYTLLAPEFRDTQEGTLHFYYLLRENGGPLSVAHSFQEHAAQLAEALAAGPANQERNQHFVRNFIRPYGIGVPATPKLVDALEELAAGPAPGPRRRPRAANWLYWLLAPLLFCAHRYRKRRLGLNLSAPKSAARVLLRRSLELGPVQRAIARYALPTLETTTGQRGSPDGQRAAGESPLGAGTRGDSNHERPQPAALQEPSYAVRAAEIIDRLASEPRAQIIAGPWLSEVGFELLYWIPFLNWAVERRPELAERLIVVSRGGPVSWYAHVSGKYADIFDHFTPEAYREALHKAAAARSGKQKQLEISEFEQNLIQRVSQRLDLERVELLHPSTMYRFFRELFKEDRVQLMSRISDYRTLPVPATGPLEGLLPDDYVAVRFYFNYSFPDTHENRSFISSVLRNLTEKTDVVLLNIGMPLDDHWDFDAFDSAKLLRFDRFVRASNNLELQTILISRARAFVGTYGGLSYLPPFFNVPSVCFYSKPERFNVCHLELANRVFRNPGWGDFLALHIDQVNLFGVLGDIGRRAAAGSVVG